LLSRTVDAVVGGDHLAEAHVLAVHDEVAPVREPVRGSEGFVALAEDGRADIEPVSVLQPLVQHAGGVDVALEDSLGRSFDGRERLDRGVEASIERSDAVVDGARGRGRGVGVDGDRDLDGCGGGCDHHIARGKVSIGACLGICFVSLRFYNPET